MNIEEMFWGAMQKMFGFEHKNHALDVPAEVREAAHEQNNETMRLRAEIALLPYRPDVLRDLIDRMQHRISARGH